MAWIYLAESEDSQRPWNPGSGRSPTVRSTDTLRLSCSQGCPPENCPLRQFGMTCEQCREVPSIPPLRSSMEVHPVSRGHRQESEKGKPMNETCGLKPCDSSNKSNQECVFLKTLMSLQPTNISWRLSNALKRLGTLSHGRLSSRHRMSEHRTKGKESGLLPTLRANRWGFPDSHGSMKAWFPTLTRRDSRSFKGAEPPPNHTGGPNLIQTIGGPLNPEWAEWFMGFPTAWTELKPWATQWFRSKRGKRSCVSAA